MILFYFILTNHKHSSDHEIHLLIFKSVKSKQYVSHQSPRLVEFMKVHSAQKLLLFLYHYLLHLAAKALNEKACPLEVYKTAAGSIRIHLSFLWVLTS